MAETPGRRVLIVEDEAMVSLLLEDMLEELGHVVVGIGSRLDSALDLARDCACDVAVLDVNLGGKASRPVAHVLKSRGVPFIVASGYGDSGLDEDYRGAPLLKKPFQLEQLSEAICLAIGSDRS
jgi:DNA-binding response OmpR family regulator